jgi:anti-sigma-K factor RskA
MLSDEQLRELFSAYIDGDVSAEVRDQIERRCDEEEDLRAELEDLRELVGTLSSFPEVSAPQGFTSRVLAEVEDLDIPSQQARGAASASAHDQALDSMSVPLWLKGSIAASLAATLMVGFFVLRAPLQGDSQELASVGPAAEAIGSWDVPMGTGIDELPSLPMDEAEDDSIGRLADTDGVVSVGALEEEPAAGLRQDRFSKSIQPAEPASPPQQSVKGKQAGGDMQVLARGKRRPSKGSGLKEVTSDQTQRVYEAEHEGEQVQLGSANEPAVKTAETADEKALENDGVVALTENKGVPPDLIEMMQEEVISIGALRRGNGSSGSGALPQSSNAARRSAARRDSSSAGSARAESADSASADKARFAGEEAALSASEEMVMVSEEQDQEAVDVPSIAAKVAIGTLRVSSPDVIETMSAQMAARLWSVQNLTPLSDASSSRPAVGSQVLQIMVPEGDEDDLSRLLSSYGALNTDRLLAAAHDGNARLRLTVRWGN